MCAGLFVSNLDPEAAAARSKSAPSARTAACCRSPRSRAWKSSSRARARSRSPRSTSSPRFWPRRSTPPSSTTSSSTPRPTGHTLRLLTLPSAWSGYVDEHPAGASCLGPLAGLDQRREQYAAAVATLADPALTTLVLVSRAEDSALREAARASAELAALGVANQRLVLNGLVRDPGDDPAALAFTDRQSAALDGAPAQLAPLPAAAVDLIAGDVTGLAALRRAGRRRRRTCRRPRPTLRPSTFRALMS